jgi:hypothetical protein
MAVPPRRPGPHHRREGSKPSHPADDQIADFTAIGGRYLAWLIRVAVAVLAEHDVEAGGLLLPLVLAELLPRQPVS